MKSLDLGQTTEFRTSAPCTNHTDTRKPYH